MMMMMMMIKMMHRRCDDYDHYRPDDHIDDNEGEGEEENEQELNTAFYRTSTVFFIFVDTVTPQIKS